MRSLRLRVLGPAIGRQFELFSLKTWFGMAPVRGRCHGRGVAMNSSRIPKHQVLRQALSRRMLWYRQHAPQPCFGPAQGRRVLPLRDLQGRLVRTFTTPVSSMHMPVAQRTGCARHLLHTLIVDKAEYDHCVTEAPQQAHQCEHLDRTA